MADKFSSKKRSEIMSKITGKDTKYEQMVRKWLFAHGFRYRKNDKRYPGKPDIVLPAYRTVIFINGCFWHGHKNCKYFTIPKTRTDFWLSKINENMERDKRNIASLEELGWNIIVIWQCELRKDPNIRLEKLINELKSPYPQHPDLK